VILKPSRPTCRTSISARWRHRHRSAAARHPLCRGRLGKPDAGRLGAWLGMLVRRHGSQQFTYFQQVCGIECAPVSGELTYGLERLAMYVQGVDNVYDLNFNGREGAKRSPMAMSSCRPSRNIHATISRSPTPRCCSSTSRMPKRNAKAILKAGAPAATPGACTNACCRPTTSASRRHVFNLLDARGVISVTERQGYILGCATCRASAARRSC
jgi:glycyl-tRNA synthetase alpha chain